MNVKHTVGRYLEHGPPQDLSVCHDDDHLRRELTEAHQRITIAEVRRLEDPEAKLKGCDLDRRGPGRPVTSGRAVRLRDDRGDRMTIVGESVKRWNGERRGSDEDDRH